MLINFVGVNYIQHNDVILLLYTQLYYKHTKFQLTYFTEERFITFSTDRCDKIGNLF